MGPSIEKLRERTLSRDARGALPVGEADFLRSLGGPSLLHVAGRDSRRMRFVAGLVHGNEPSGLRAIHRWLRSSAVPAVDVLFFLGNVAAALGSPLFGRRHEVGRPDWNRIWLDPPIGAEGEMVRTVLGRLLESPVEALVDLHNNTGHNPPYGVGPRSEPAFLNLVGLFGRIYVHSDLRLGALVEAAARHVPSVTIECGRAGDPSADAVALRGLERFLVLEALETERIEAPEPRRLERPVRVRVAEGTTLAFGDARVPGVDLTLRADIDRHNFDRLEAGTALGWLADPAVWPLEAFDVGEQDRSRELFGRRGDLLEARQPLVPIMMTTDPNAALADCLFYTVHPVD